MDFALTATVTGAGIGDFVNVSFDKNLSISLISGHVSAANQVKVTMRNRSGGNLDYGTLTAYIEVEKRFN